MPHWTEAELEARIDEIDEHLATGMTSHNVDGLSMSFDLDALRRERAKLAAALSELQGSPRPRNTSIDLGGAFG